jgi:hypothetical protein
MLSPAVSPFTERSLDEPFVFLSFLVPIPPELVKLPVPPLVYFLRLSVELLAILFFREELGILLHVVRSILQ